jgi:TonB family protein
MHLVQWVAWLAFPLGSWASGQNNTPADVEAAHVYAYGSEVSPPEILPFSAPLNPPGNCSDRFDGKVKLSLEIDAAGTPQKIMFIEPHFDDLDRSAIQIAATDRFKPGTHSGTPVPVLASLELRIKSCIQDSVDAAGNKGQILRMRELPEQTLGKPGEAKVNTIVVGSKSKNHNVSPPLPLNSVMAQYSDAGRRLHINGNCMVSVIVDKYGMPQDPRVLRSLEPGMDTNALIAVRKYRFKPAMKDGTPIPVMITVQVEFRQS